MSSVGSAFAQIGARRGYFIATGSVVQYAITQDVNGAVVAAGVVAGSSYSSGAILEDMGEIAKYGGFLFRRVRAVTQIPTGNITVASYFIAMPGGEYPIQGVSAAGLDSTGGSIVAAPVARLG